MNEGHTTSVVQKYLDELAGLHGEMAAEPIVQSLLGKSVNRLHLLCSTLLYRNYPRLLRPPLNLEPEELLGAVVERLIKALREVRPTTVRRFFALANQHIRWELNDLVRRLDEQASQVQLLESLLKAPPESSGSPLSANVRRIIETIENLPDEECEAFNLVRIQGMTQTEAATLLGVSAKTIQRRLNRSLVLLTSQLGDLHPQRAITDP
ncbi:MAG: sigma-70 family polymerase sigma factor [Planctomycetaceae bacterium]|nr:sigma-70 family polymerase sigma factor [Planctomycetaceae bacterium]